MTISKPVAPSAKLKLPSGGNPGCVGSSCVLDFNSKPFKYDITFKMYQPTGDIDIFGNLCADEGECL